MKDGCRWFGSVHLHQDAELRHQKDSWVPEVPPERLPKSPFWSSAHGHKEVSTLPSSLSLFFLPSGHPSHPSCQSCSLLLGLRCHYSCLPSDLPWFVAKSHATPSGRPPPRPTPLLRRTMCLHATITTGDTKRWTRSVGLRVFTRAPQNHI